MSGRRLLRLRRRAKYIIAEFDDGTAMLLHLGMSGRMTISAAAPAQFDKHDHLIFMAEGGPVVCFNDARRFGVVDLATTATIDAHPLLAALGPEPLGNHFNGPVLAAGLRGRGTAIKPLLLDQRLVAGIGNIYASEALFRAGISPRRKGGSVTGGRADRLAVAIREVLEAAIRGACSATMFSRMANWAIFSMPSRSMGGPARLVLTRLWPADPALGANRAHDFFLFQLSALG